MRRSEGNSAMMRQEQELSSVRDPERRWLITGSANKGGDKVQSVMPGPSFGVA